MCPEILPTLNEVLQDATLAQGIGWDLVHNLVSIPGSEQCLETTARFGGPREVKSLEVLGGFPDDVKDAGGEHAHEGDEGGTTRMRTPPVR